MANKLEYSTPKAIFWREDEQNDRADSPDSNMSAQDDSCADQAGSPLSHQRLQVLFSDIENILVIDRTVGIPPIRAAYFLEKADEYLRLLNHVAYNQLLSSCLLNKVQRFKLDLELLACHLTQYIE